MMENEYHIRATDTAVTETQLRDMLKNIPLPDVLDDALLELLQIDRVYPTDRPIVEPHQYVLRAGIEQDLTGLWRQRWVTMAWPTDVIDYYTKSGKIDKWNAIKAERDRRKDSSGFPCNGYWWHSDSVSKVQHLGNKDTARDLLAKGNQPSDPLVDPISGMVIIWKTMGDLWCPMTIQMAIDVVNAGKYYELMHHKAAEVHRAAMLNSVEPAAYEDYKTSGWPQSYEEWKATN